MRQTEISNVQLCDRMTLTTDELRMTLGCGRGSAVKIGLAANARIVVSPKRILWNSKRIQDYLDSISEGEDK